MNLRPELMPPQLDENKIARLSALAARIDGANPGQWEEELAEFNQLAGTDIPFEHFQGIYGGENHETWVHRLLVRQSVRPVPGVTRAELLEVIRRALPTTGDPECEAYMAIFDVNVPMQGASNLIFYPHDHDMHSNTWGGGRPINEYNPTPEEIVELALTKHR